VSRAFIFPGQGSQFVGMGKDLAESFPEAKQTFQEIDDAIGEKLSALIFDGPEDELNLTENTQPALMAVSMAIVNVLKRQAGIDFGKACAFMAGHSLGEYSALTAAGALELKVTAVLLKRRGAAMQKAVPAGQGAMAAILGLEWEQVKTLTKKATDQAGGDEICVAANDNTTGQVVISGTSRAVDIAVNLASEAGAKKALPLPVSVPAHSPKMASAAQTMSYALADTDIRPPCVPVVSNVTATGEDDPATIRRLLVEQITAPVRWRESILWMKDQGVDEMIELGAGKVLSGLVKRTDKDITAESIGTPEQIDDLIERLNHKKD